MCRGAARTRRILALAALLTLGALAAPRPSLAAGVSAPAGFEMTRGVQQSLKRLQELWLQWLAASLQDNPGRAGETLRLLQSTARQLGFVRLPDLAQGAAARALQSARDGDFARARRELDAAEALDPGRAEVAFADAAVARRQGDWMRAVASSSSGFRRLLKGPSGRALGARALLWFLLAAILAALTFVAVEAVARGGKLYGDLLARFGAKLPAAAAHAAALLLLFAPLALPGGVAWTALIWSALLWTYGSTSERIAFAAVWLTLGAAPVGAAAIERELALAQSPPMRAIDHFGQGRLAGSLFADLQVLRSALPDDPDVVELVADVHRTLGQWDIARPLYRQSLARDGSFSTALVNLGADAFRTGDFAAANNYFQRAAEGDAASAAAWYNLSLSYSESYEFDDSREALARAREIDGELVDRWIATPNPDRVLTFNGGLARRREIGEKLRQAWTRDGEGEGDEEAAPSRPEMLQPAIAATATALAAIFWHLLGGVRFVVVPAPATAGGRRGPVMRWSRALLPAVDFAVAGRGGAVAANVVLLSALVTLPRLSTLGGDFPGSVPVARLCSLIALIGALAYLAFVIHRERSAGAG
jgi:tetratricopeptide (TPR) repeat protein